MNKYSTQRGFTIIETLVAITILMISIVGPLTVSHKGLLASLYAANQVTASYLAQDAVEYIKNIRDNNVIDANNGANVSWLRGLSGCAANNPCRIDTILGDPSNADPTVMGIANCDPAAATANCWLYKSASDVTSRYSHNSALQKTQYERYFYLAQKGSFTNEAQIIVIVTWNVGAVTNEIKYDNEIFNITK